MTDIIIKKINEVYIKILAEPHIIMEMSGHFTFEVPGAKFMPSFQNRVWDGKIRLLNSMTCMIYAGLIEEIKRFAKKNDYSVEVDKSLLPEEFTEKEANEFIEWLNPTFKPRPHQMDAFLYSVRNRRALLVSPTASGKSFIIYLLARWYNKKTLIVVPTTSLVSQLASDFADYGFDSDAHVHKIYSGQEKHSNKQVTITTWQSVYKKDKKFFEEYEVIIGDEAHLFKAKSLTSILEKMTECVYRFGLTGTLDDIQTNKLVLEGLFGPVKKVITTAELIENKTLSKFKIKAIVFKYPEEVSKVVSKMDYQAEMDFIVKCQARNKFITNLAKSLEGNTLILFQYVEKHGKALFKLICEACPDRNVYFVSGEIKGDKREEIRKVVEEDNNAIIVASYGTFSTGINIKKLHNVIFASPSKSKVRNLQSIGRVLRTSDGKLFATLYDLSDDFSYKSKRNTTLLHFVERIRIYNAEQFDYNIYKVDIDTTL